MGRHLEIRLADADRQRWNLPEWLPYDHEQLLDTPADVLDRWEQQIGVSLEQVLEEVGQETARARRAVAWIACTQAGHDVDWAEFTPATLRMGFRAAGGDDADPPDSSPSNGSGKESTPDPLPSPSEQSSPE